MRSLVHSVVLIVLIRSAATVVMVHAQAPLFRSGIELLEVDASVVSSSTGTLVTGLQAGDFTVLVDGKPRQVVSAEYVSDLFQRAGRPNDAPDASISTNQDHRRGRLIVLALDQNNMTIGRVRAMSSAAGRFIDGLDPADQVALYGFPMPGPAVDFTTDHEAVKRELGALRGYTSADRLQFNIADHEAFLFDLRAEPMQMAAVLTRLCGGQDAATRVTCEGEVAEEARQVAQGIRMRTAESVSALSALLTHLRDIPGAKTMVLMSDGLNLEVVDQDAGAIARLAAAARTAMRVMIFERDNWSAADRFAPPSTLRDRVMREGGLEELASQSGGALFRVVASPAPIFARIASEMAGHYLLGVEALPADRDGRRHDIRVRTGRGDVDVRSRQEFQYRASNEDPVERATLAARVLRSRMPATDLPMRVTTYCYQDAGGTAPRVVIAAEIEPATAGAADVSMAYAFYDTSGKAVAAGEERKVFTNSNERPLHYAASLILKPGTYRLRVAAIDAAGLAGSVDREVQVWSVSAQRLALGDLMVAGDGDSRDEHTIRPSVLPTARGNGQIRAMTEVYSNAPGLLEHVSVAFEVARDPDGPALRSGMAGYYVRPSGMSAQASGGISVDALSQGNYVLRAIVREGDKTVGKLVRPFVLTPASLP